MADHYPSRPNTEQPAGPKYGNISYSILQDIELAVITLKEIKQLLHTHYQCDTALLPSIALQINNFSSTCYSHNPASADTEFKHSLCTIMRRLLYERNNIVHMEGIDFLKDRTKFISQSKQVFEQLSPFCKGVLCVTPSRHGVLIPCPNSQSLLEDLTFIDYNQYEDISVAVKVTKRIDRILREIFRQSGDTLEQKIERFPYANDNMKRKMCQVNTIRNKLIEERYSNNLDNRVEFINQAKSIFSHLMSVVGSQQYQHFQSYNINSDIDQLSNMWSSSSNNITSPLPQHDTTLYEKLGEPFHDDSTIDLGTFSAFEPLESSTQKNYQVMVRDRGPPGARWDKDRHELFSDQCRKICRNLCIGISLIGVLIIAAIIALKWII